MIARQNQWLPGVFTALAGWFLGIGLLKFGNPVLLDYLVTPPQGVLEFALQSWPPAWLYPGLVVLTLLGLCVARWKSPRPRWLLVLPLVWLAWQFIAATHTVDARLTRPTLVHFVAVVAGFYLGLFALGSVRSLNLFWSGLLFGFMIVLWTGFDQHFGGLEATRKFIYSQPGWEHMTPDQLKRISSNRIFGTLLYPNTFAGVILMLLPPLLVAVWGMSARLTRPTRWMILTILASSASASLYWSGSKAGWLIALVMLLVLAAVQVRLPKWWRLGLLAILLAGGLFGFFTRFAGYFAKGATSVSARKEYWTAAWKTFCERPVFGSGPGTFATSYRRIKPPDAEMARLTHNDYLEQASDSGVVGFAAYTLFVVGSLAVLYRRTKHDAGQFAVWIGLFGWGLQSTVEFGLYIPAVGGTAFWLLGWLWGTSHDAPTLEPRQTTGHQPQHR